MSDMFKNYDNGINLNLDSCPHNCPPEAKDMRPLQSTPNIGLLYNINDKIYGVVVKHGMPFTLYFHLEDACGRPLLELLLGSRIHFKICTLKGKTVLEKVFSGQDIATPAQDIVIALGQADIEKLSKESFTLDVRLETGSEIYVLFANTDGFLVVR